VAVVAAVVIEPLVQQPVQRSAAVVVVIEPLVQQPVQRSVVVVLEVWVE